MWHTPSVVAHTSGARERAGPGGATQGWTPSSEARSGPRTRRMRFGPGVRRRRDAWAGNDALAATSGPRGDVRDPASGRGTRPGTAVGGRRHVGIAGGRRIAGAPRGTAGDLGSMVIAPHRARRGPRTVTGTAVTVSGVGGVVSTRLRVFRGDGS